MLPPKPVILNPGFTKTLLCSGKQGEGSYSEPYLKKIFSGISHYV